MDGMGLKIDTVRLSGGGARSPFWRQLQANIYNKKVATISSHEGGAYGVAILAGVGTGVWKNVPEACKAVISEVERLKGESNMSDPKRYGMSWGKDEEGYIYISPHESPKGMWVKWEDYQSLKNPRNNS
jgi:ribulose kinase